MATEGEGLAEERVAAQRLVAALRAELDGIILEQEANPPDDEHDVEGASVAYERARVRALLARAEAQVAALDDAAGRMASASYGRCEACDRPIGDERLAAVPTTRRCVACASATRSGGLAVRPRASVRLQGPG